MIYIGDGNKKARQVISPYIGVGGKARRVLKGYIGVNGKARLFYDYLDDIDYVEIEFYDLQYYSAQTSGGGTKLAEGKTAVGQYGSSITLGDDGNSTITARLYAKGTATNVADSYGGLYTHFRFWLVLKGGHRVRLDYAKTNDGKAISLTAGFGNFSHTGSGYWYPYLWLLGDSETFGVERTSYSASIELQSGYTGGASAFTYYSNSYVQVDYSFRGPVTVGNKTYPLKVRDSIS